MNAYRASLLTPEMIYGDNAKLQTAEEAARGSEKEEARREERAQGTITRQSSGAIPMSKGMNQKKQEKKKPAKTLEEKRAVKKAKKAARAFLQSP